MGTIKPFRNVDVNSPPRITLAMGLWISLPERLPPSARGTSANAEQSAVIRMGVKRSIEPIMTLSRFEWPSLSRSLYREMSSIPLRVAIPNSEIKPMMA